MNKIFNSTEKWVRPANHEGKEAVNAVYDNYTALGSPKGKDDKWYFEARWTHGKIEVNLNPLTEEQAVKKMEEGKDIMTLDEGLAQKIVSRFKNGGPGRWGDLKVEEAHHNHQKADGHYDHLHYGRNANERLHCWIWKTDQHHYQRIDVENGYLQVTRDDTDETQEIRINAYGKDGTH